MPRLNLRYTALAQKDLSEIYNYLAERNEDAARRVVNAVEQTAKLLSDHPYSARPTDMADVRVKPLAGFPCFLFYETSNSHLTILRVWHMAREWPNDLLS